MIIQVSYIKYTITAMNLKIQVEKKLQMIGSSSSLNENHLKDHGQNQIMCYCVSRTCCIRRMTEKISPISMLYIHSAFEVIFSLIHES